MACRVVVIKKFRYRGDANEEWSNEYTLTGATPADATAWRTLFDALVAQEKTCYTARTTVVAGYGYDDEAATAHAVWSVDLTVSPNTPVAGTAVPTTGAVEPPGDAAAWVRWKLNRNNSRGKPIYLRKYFHDVWTAGSGGSGDSDTVNTAQGTALGAFGTKMMNGTFLDARVVKAAGHSDTIVSTGHSTYVTTRTLKRRGKRPS